MIKNISRLLPFALLALVVTWYGCKKEAALTIPPEQAHFMNVTSGAYFITAPGVTYKIPLGLTTTANVDRTINVAITSPTGAVLGTHYTVNKTSFVIPAGKVIDTLVITGNYALYTAGRKDTLNIAIQSTDKGGVASSTYNSVFTLFMRGPCAEQEVATAPSFLNASYKSTERGYDETTGALAYTYAPGGGYISAVSGATTTSATTAQITVSNIWEMGAGVTAKFNLDYSNFSNKRVTVAGSQKLGSGTLVGLSATYDLYIDPATGANPAPDEGTWTYCGTSNIVIKYRISVHSAATGANLGNLTSSGASLFTQTLVKQ